METCVRIIIIAFLNITIISNFIYANPTESLTDFIIGKKCPGDYDFRCIRWKMVQDDVLRSELPTNTIQRNNVKLIYKTAYKGIDANLQYIFNTEGLLTYASYIVYVNPAQSKIIYENIKQEYKKSFGSPRYLEKFSTYQFKNGNTNIYLGITSANDKINIIYTDLEFKRWVLFLINIKKYF
jgi:hypothetical protein